MTPTSIITVPDERLRQKSKPIEKFGEEHAGLVAKMIKVMDAANGVGLAAVQLGVLLRLVTIDVSGKRNCCQVYVNPEIFWYSSEKVKSSEGCLSIPGFTAELLRSKMVMVRYQDHLGRKKEIKAKGPLAVCLQHEIDHLNGILISDEQIKWVGAYQAPTTG